MIAGASIALVKAGADRTVHFANFAGRRDLAGTDRPNRLVGDGELGPASETVGNRTGELTQNGCDGFASLAHLERFADA